MSQLSPKQSGLDNLEVTTTCSFFFFFTMTTFHCEKVITISKHYIYRIPTKSLRFDKMLVNYRLKNKQKIFETIQSYTLYPTCHIFQMKTNKNDQMT